MTTKKGVWNLQQVRDKKLQDLWGYSASGDLGTLWSWGYNYYGAGGVNDAYPVRYSSPVQVPGTTWASDTVFPAGSGAYNSAWIKGDGTLWSMGYGGAGALGQNDRTSRSSPIQIPGTTWSKSALSYYILYGIKTDGTLWAWGHNGAGALAQNDAHPTQYSSPAQIPGTTWKDIRGQGAGSMGAIASKTDGTLWVWGLNESGELTTTDRGSRSSPIQIAGTTWDKIGAGLNKYYSIKTDGTLWSWGNNAYGALGHSSQHWIKISSPTQLGSDTTWSSVTSTNYHTVATKTDGTFWAWGYNSYGGLGHNNQTAYSSPVQVGSGTDWSKVWAAKYGSAALKTNGTLWMMGRNHLGDLGQNNLTQYSSPTQIPGTWIDGNYATGQASFIKA